MTQRSDAPQLISFERRPNELDPDGISIGQIFSSLWRRRWVLLSTTLCLTAAGFVVLKSLTPTYTSTAMIVLSGQEDSVVDLQQGYARPATIDAVVRSETDALRS